MSELNHIGILGMKWGRRKAKGPMTQKQIEKMQKKEAKKRAKILASPEKLKRNLDKFSDAEVKRAMDKMKLERELRSLSKEKMSAGSSYANTILAYGTTAVTAYSIYKSPLGQRIKDAIVDALRD